MELVASEVEQIIAQSATREPDREPGSPADLGVLQRAMPRRDDDAKAQFIVFEDCDSNLEQQRGGCVQLGSDGGGLDVYVDSDLEDEPAAKPVISRAAIAPQGTPTLAVFDDNADESTLGQLPSWGDPAFGDAMRSLYDA